MRQIPILGPLSASLVDRSKQRIRWLVSFGLIVLGLVQASTAQAQNVTLAQPNDQRQLDGCASCASFTTGYSTPAFGFNGGSVSTLLRYSSELARPTGYVELNVKYAGPNRPTRIRIQLRKMSDTTLITLTSDSTQAYVRGDTTNLRIAAQYTANGHATAVEYVTAIVTAFYGDSAAPSSSVTDSITNVRVLVQNEEGSPYGRGWTVAGDARIYEQANGSLLLADGVGGLAYYALVSCSGTPSVCTYTSPTGDYSTMVKTDTVWTRTGRAGDVATWSSLGYLRKTTDRWGNARLFARTSCGSFTCLASVKDSTTVGGTAVTKTTTFAYSGGSGKLVSITLPDGRQSTFTVTSGSGGRLTAITDPDGRTALKARYTYGGLDSLAGRDTTTTNIVYDAYNQVSMLIGPSMAIDSGTTVRDTIRITSQRRQLLEGQTKKGSLATVNADLRDSTFLIVTDARGTTSYTSSHISGAPGKNVVRSATGATIWQTFTYDSVYHLTRAWDKTAAEEYSWDGPRLQTLTKVHFVPGSDEVTSYWYSSYYDQLDSITVNGTRRARYFYSGSHLAPDSVKADSAIVSRFTYDARGRVLSVTEQGGNRTVSTQFETTHGNPSSVTRTASSAPTATTTVTYDVSGRATSVTDPLGRVYATKFDSLNRVIREIGPNGDTTRFVTHDSTRTDTLTDPKGQRYITVRNSRGLVTRQEDPLAKSDYLWYDRLGRAVKAQNRRGDSIRVEYDAFDRVTRRRAWTAAGQLDSTRFAFDTVFGFWIAASNAESIDTLEIADGGQPVSARTIRSGKRFKIQYDYLGSGFDTSMTVVWRDSAFATLWADSTWTGFNAYRQVFEIADFGSKVTSYGHDQWGRINGITLPTNANTAYKLKKSITYSGADSPLTETYTGQSIGTSQNRTHLYYDALDRAGKDSSAATDNPIRWYGYDAARRLSYYEDWKNNMEVVEWEYFWDEIHQEWDSIPAAWGPGMVRSADYTYDKVANRTDHNATVNTGNRLVAFDGWTITYDDAGFITKRKKGTDSLVYSWNALGQLTQVVSPGYTVTYGYDGFGNRIRKTVNGTATRYILDRGQVLVELDNSWQPAAKYTYYPGIDRPHSMLRAGKRYYFLQDAHGNVTGVADSAGVLKNTYEYTPYGEALSATGTVTNPYRYKGREWDAEARLYFMRARYYDPLLGRFISEDPIGLDGGINPTAFVGSDPVNRADPTGLKQCQLWYLVEWTWVDGRKAGYEILEKYYVCGREEGGGGGSAGAPSGPVKIGCTERPATRVPSSFGFAYGSTIEAGLPVIGGFSLQASAGNGAFPTGGQHYLTYADVAYFMNHSSGVPDQSAIKPQVIGAFAGRGASVWFSNATSSEQLRGLFKTLSVNFGAPGTSVSVVFATGGGVWHLSIGLPGTGPSAGASVSAVTTNTVTTEGCN